MKHDPNLQRDSISLDKPLSKKVDKQAVTGTGKSLY